MVNLNARASHWLPLPAFGKAPYNRTSHEEGCPCRLSARLSRRLRRSDHGGRWTGDEDSRGSRPSDDPRILVWQGGQVSGPGVFAGSRAVSDAEGGGEGAGGGERGR